MKLSDRLAVILCRADKRCKSSGICHQHGMSPYSLEHGIKAWLVSVGKPATPAAWVYPIGSGAPQYGVAHLAGSMWRGKYGQERKALLRFLIRYYRERGL